MVFKVKYEWEIKNIEDFSESKSFEVFSPIFYASPDEVCLGWKVSLLCSDATQRCGIYLCFDDQAFKPPIYAKFTCKGFNMKKELVFEKTTGQFKNLEEENTSWWQIKAIDGCNIKSLKSISFSIELVRKKPLESIEVESIPRYSSNPERKVNKSSAEPLNHLSIRALQADLLKLYESEDFNDVTVTCGKRDFKVHKCILVSRSTVLKSIFENEWEVNIPKTITHQLNGIDPEAFRLFLKFLYTGTINIPIDMITDVFELSEKYDIEDLSKICKCEMVKNIGVSTAIPFLISADNHGMHHMKTNVLKFIKGNTKAVMETEAFKTSMTQRPDLMVAILASITCNEE